MKYNSHLINNYSESAFKALLVNIDRCEELVTKRFNRYKKLDVIPNDIKLIDALDNYLIKQMMETICP